MARKFGAADTLFLPFDDAGLPVPVKGEKWLYLNAQPPAQPIAPEFLGALTRVQPWRNIALDLDRAGMTSQPVFEPMETDLFSGALILASRHRLETEMMINQAIAATKSGQPIVIAGSKTDGIGPIRKWISAQLPIGEALAKHHAKVFWLDAPAHPIAQSRPAVPAPGFVAQPGMFSFDRVDQGSALLAAHLPSNLDGHVADFGCGWGYLSAALVNAGGALTKLTLIDAHAPSLHAAKANIAIRMPDLSVETAWLDLSRETPEGVFDAVVMNPPFHTQSHTDVDLGQAFIEKAALRLRQGGRAYIVANVKLPYEKMLEKHFKRHEQLARENGFKLFVAFR